MKNAFFRRLPAFLCLLFAASCVPLESGRPLPGLSITFLDVGQGDAALIVFPDGRTLMVDAGPDSGRVDSLIALKGAGRIDDLVITHAHRDHYGGARGLLLGATVGRVWFNVNDLADQRDTGFLNLVRLVSDTLGMDTSVAVAGRVLCSDQEARAVFLWPDAAGGEANAFSLVLRLESGKSSALLAGDIGFETEKALLSRGLGPCNLLKAGHHGSATSSSTAFLSALCPEITVISVGADNGYGHPDNAAVQRMAACGGAIFRTDLDGTIDAWMDESGESATGKRD